MRAWIAVVTLALAGCAAQQTRVAQGPPIASPSDTNIYASGEITSSASEVSRNQAANPALNGNGTTGPTAKR